jgi:hypothetical protein
MRRAVLKMMRACRSSDATTRTCAPSTPSASSPYSPMAAASVDFPFPAGMLTSPWRGRGSSSTPRTMSRCQGRSLSRFRAPVPLGTTLARGDTLSKASEAAGCSLATAKRRWAEPAFRQRVIQAQEDGRRQRQAIVYASWHLGVQLVPAALSTLQATLQDPRASHLDKARAARVLLRAYGPRAEPPAPTVLSVADEQASEAMAEQVRQLLARANVVDLDAHRAAPLGYAPVAGEPSWTPPATAAGWPGEDLDDEELEATGVGQEYPNASPPAPVGPPEPPPEPPAAEVDRAEDVDAARAWLREHPRRPPAGPELVTWLEGRRVVGLDQPPPDRPRPRRRRRRTLS